jgi:hypothetical protein
LNSFHPALQKCRSFRGGIGRIVAKNLRFEVEKRCLLVRFAHKNVFTGGQDGEVGMVGRENVATCWGFW